jgi:hypothetical protein
LKVDPICEGGEVLIIAEEVEVKGACEVRLVDFSSSFKSGDCLLLLIQLIVPFSISINDASKSFTEEPSDCADLGLALHPGNLNELLKAIIDFYSYLFLILIS